MSSAPEVATDTVAGFREAFHRDRKELIGEHGPEAFDQAQVLYVCRNTGRKVVVRDALQPASGGSARAFVEGLGAGWWQSRQAFHGEAEPGLDLQPVAGLYGHYLPEVGFDYSLEFEGDGPTRAWRMNARGRVTALVLPEDEGMFRDQVGTFFDARAGWRWLIEQHLASGGVEVAEIQSGYLCGVRKGVPGDPNPADREDPQLEAAFGRWGTERYDTLEFLNSADADALPFPGERYDEWLGGHAGVAAASEVELFVLADASAFLACIEDLASERGVAVEWIDPEGDLRVAFNADGLRVEQDFAWPFLRTVHTGRSFVAGVAAFYAPTIVALDEARELVQVARDAIPGYAMDVVDGCALRIARADGAEVGRWNLITLGGRQSLMGAEGRAAFLSLLGWDAEAEAFVERPFRLDRCPVTGAPARVGKVVRPNRLLGADPRTLLGVTIGAHHVYFTLEGPEHSTPIEVGPGRDLQAVELAYRAGLPEATWSVVAHQVLPDALVMVGFDFGALVLEPGPIEALLKHFGQSASGTVQAYGFFPDVLVVAPNALQGDALSLARATARALEVTHFPGRGWPLDVARPVTLTGEPLGRVEIVA